MTNGRSYPNSQTRYQSRPRVTLQTRRRFLALLIASPAARVETVLRLRDCGCDATPQTSLGAIVDLAANICEWNGMEIACNLIREYDNQTGAQHFEYAMPEETGNVNIWRVNADNTLTYQNPTQTDLYPITQAPILNYHQTATPYDNPVFPGQTAIDYHQAPAINPTSPQPAPPPVVRYGAPPPPGWWDYGNPNDPYRSTVNQQPSIRRTAPTTPQPQYTVTNTVTPGTATATGSGGQGDGQGNPPITPAPAVNEPIGAPRPPGAPAEEPGIIDRIKEAPGWAIAAAAIAAGVIFTSRSR